MKRCLGCHEVKPLDQFPSPSALACNFCTPVSDALSAAIMRRRPTSIGPDHAHVLGQHGHNPTMVQRAQTREIKRDPAISKIEDAVIESGGTVLHVNTAADPKFAQYNDIRTQRATVKDDSVARALLSGSHTREVGLDETVDISSGNVKFQVVPKHDHRPLIDKVHEATFHNPVGLQWIKDKYGLRMLLRKAHCFTVDDATSGMITDFSLAIKTDLESARQLAIPPFPVTWIDFNNTARISRAREVGLAMTPSAQGVAYGAVVERVGWLIHPADIGGQYLTYFCETEQGVMCAPLSFWWHNGRMNPNVAAADREPELDAFLRGIALGIKDCNVDPVDAYPCPTNLHIDLSKSHHSRQVRDLMVEIAGELRHAWGFLIAIGAGHLGSQPMTAPQPLHTDIRTMPNGKPLLPLEHKLLHLHLRKNLTPEKVVARAVTHHKHRWHEVRSHWRTIKNKADGTVKKRVPVKAHERGDERLGKITKTYKIER